MMSRKMAGFQIGLRSGLNDYSNHPVCDIGAVSGWL